MVLSDDMKSRPGVPAPLSHSLFYKCARTCCVCRDPHKGVHIHHIDEDAANNVESNLVVLCVGCHDDAHTRRRLSRNLTIKELRTSKRRWEKEVVSRSTRAIIAGSTDGGEEAEGEAEGGAGGHAARDGHGERIRVARVTGNRETLRRSRGRRKDVPPEIWLALEVP